MKIAKMSMILLSGILLVSGLACGTTEWQLTTSIEGQGAISPSSGTYPDGEVITLTALPESGWDFDHWGVQASGSANPITVTMDADKTVSAYFTLAPSPSPTPTPTPLAGYLPYTDAANGFSIAHPETWSKAQNLPLVHITFDDSVLCDLVAASFQVASDTLPFSMTVQEYHAATIVPFQADPGYTFSYAEVITVDGKNAIKHVYTISRAGFSSKQMEVMLVEDLTVWTILFSTVPICWSQYENTFDTITDSFQLLH